MTLDRRNYFRYVVANPHQESSLTESLQANEAVAALAERRQKNAGLERKNNAELYAGSPMYYYCRLCGAEIVLPECHDPPAPSHCSDCSDLRELGWNERLRGFCNTVQPCADCVGSGKRSYRGFGLRTCQTCGGRGKEVIEKS